MTEPFVSKSPPFTCDEDECEEDGVWGRQPDGEGLKVWCAIHRPTGSKKVEYVY